MKNGKITINNNLLATRRPPHLHSEAAYSLFCSMTYKTQTSERVTNDDDVRMI